MEVRLTTSRLLAASGMDTVKIMKIFDFNIILHRLLLIRVVEMRMSFG